jgi:adenylate kinase family enzyme
MRLLSEGRGVHTLRGEAIREFASGTQKMERIVVVGTSCAGKTTLAASFAQRLGAPHIQLDALFWLPDWIPREDQDFRNLVSSALSEECWVVDGNYSRVRDLVWSRATSVVWLNYSLPVLLQRGLRRTIRRSVMRTRLYSGNRESLRRAFLSRHSILLWILKTYRRRRTEYRQLLQSGEWPNLEFIEVRSPREVPRLLRRFHRQGVVAPR